jgi:8-oxo-dGTP diphosphatase
VRFRQEVQALSRRSAASERLTLTHVVAGVVIDAHDRVLIAQRPPGKHLAGAWEFPGGKLEPAEARVAGLARELREEIGIEIGSPRPLMRLRHTYPYGEVLLDVWVIRRYSGSPQSLDGQQLRWCSQDELAAADLLPADRPIVAALRLPERLRQRSSPNFDLTDYRAGWSRPAQQGRLFGVYCSSTGEGAAAFSAGADFIVMRSELKDDELSGLCRSLPIPVYACGLPLEAAWSRGASGVNEITS